VYENQEEKIKMKFLLVFWDWLDRFASNFVCRVTYLGGGGGPFHQIQFNPDKIPRSYIGVKIMFCLFLSIWRGTPAS